MTIQEIQFELMKRATFNDFDGEAVVRSLLKHKDLWRGVVMDREFGALIDESMQPGYVLGVDLIKLRDIESDYWSVDTLFVLPQPGKEDELERVAKRWKADEVDWIGGKEACNFLGRWSKDEEQDEKQILRVWWD